MRMAIESDKVSATVVGAAEFPDDVRRYRISGVPKTVVNEQVEILGAQPESVFVREALEPFAAVAANGDHQEPDNRRSKP